MIFFFISGTLGVQAVTMGGSTTKNLSSFFWFFLITFWNIGDTKGQLEKCASWPQLLLRFVCFKFLFLVEWSMKQVWIGCGLWSHWNSLTNTATALSAVDMQLCWPSTSILRVVGFVLYIQYIRLKYNLCQKRCKRPCT